MQNLSIGGCAMFSDVRYTKGSEIKIGLRKEHIKLTLRARVLASKKAVDGPHPWLHRIQYISMTQANVETMEDLVMLVQRDIIADQGEVPGQDQANMLEAHLPTS